jgi:hypothetical protein
LAAIPAITAVVSAAGVAMSAVAARNQQTAQAQIARNNAKSAEHQAQAAAERGAMEQARIREKTGAVIGAGRAGWGASGAMLGSGSPFAWELGVAGEGAKDLEISKYNNELEQWGYRSQAANSSASASAYEIAGRNSLLSGVVGASATLLGKSKEMNLW